MHGEIFLNLRTYITVNTEAYFFLGREVRAVLSGPHPSSPLSPNRPSVLPQVSETCDAVFVSGKESQGARGVRVDFWWRRLRASLRWTVWAPLLPLRIELTDTTLEQVRGWRVPGPAEG